MLDQCHRSSVLNNVQLLLELMSNQQNTAATTLSDNKRVLGAALLPQTLSKQHGAAIVRRQQRLIENQRAAHVLKFN